MNNKFAWYDSKDLPSQMVQGALGQLPGWKRLEHASHFIVLDSFIQHIRNKVSSIADIGCGAGELVRICKSYGKRAVGYDLDHIIEQAAKNINPNLEFETFDAYASDFKFVEEYDLVICNSFLSELNNSVEVVNKIVANLQHGKYLIIHRQAITNKPKSYTEPYTTYAGLETPVYIMSNLEIADTLTRHNCIIIGQEEISKTQISLLIEKL